VTGVIHVNVTSTIEIQIDVEMIGAARDHAIDPVGIITGEAVQDPMNDQDVANNMKFENLKSFDPEVKFKKNNTRIKNTTFFPLLYSIKHY
jgi:hypothetical protein